MLHIVTPKYKKCFMIFQKSILRKYNVLHFLLPIVHRGKSETHKWKIELGLFNGAYLCRVGESE